MDNEYTIREYSPMSSVLKPYTREMKNSDGQVVGTFKQEADTRTFLVPFVSEENSKVWSPFSVVIR